ncbi:MAG TPA: PQQ-binding-like beta-propeller repeat protein [Thermoanaerobaculia bacterium]
MKAFRVVFLAGIAVAIAIGPHFLFAARSAQPVTASPPVKAGFDRNQSAALFVGVSRFSHRELAPVPYAADDAVNLAYLFVCDRRVRLVRADRVVIALSGQPYKDESRKKLELLRHAGAKITTADPTTIVSLLEHQAGLTRSGGILIVSISSHGFTRAGVPYILGASSVVQEPRTTISVANILDTASRSSRSLVLIDACRERLSPATRSVERQDDTAAPLLRGMSRTHGQAIFYAAAAGQYAYDDDVSRNGVFTHAFIEGLQCNAAKPRGLVTASTLGTYVDNRVRQWIQKHRDGVAGTAIQSSIDGDARNMPLSQCWVTCSGDDACKITRVATNGPTVIAFKSDGAEVWRHNAGERIKKALVEDIDADGSNDVVVATKSGIHTFDADGREVWSAREEKPLRAIAAGDLFRNHQRELVVLWGDDPSRLAIYSAEGERLAFFDSPQRLEHLIVGRPSSRYVPKIIVAAGNAVMTFDAKKLARGKPLWSGHITPRGQRVKRIEIADLDKDGKDDICITTENGTLALDFKGKVVATDAKRGSLHFHLLHSHRKRP